MEKINEDLVQRFKTGEIAIDYRKDNDLKLLNAIFVAAGYKGDAIGNSNYYKSYNEGTDWTGKIHERQLDGAKLYRIKDFLLEETVDNYEIY